MNVAPAPTPAPVVSPAANRQPSPVFRITPAPETDGIVRGTADEDGTLKVVFDLCQSSDPESDTLFFSHDVDGDGRDEHGGPTGAGCRRQYEYRAAMFELEKYRARHCVVDLDENGNARREPLCRSYEIEVTGARPKPQPTPVPAPTPCPIAPGAGNWTLSWAAFTCTCNAETVAILEDFETDFFGRCFHSGGWPDFAGAMCSCRSF